MFAAVFDLDLKCEQRCIKVKGVSVFPRTVSRCEGVH